MWLLFILTLVWILTSREDYIESDHTQDCNYSSRDKAVKEWAQVFGTCKLTTL